MSTIDIGGAGVGAVLMVGKLLDVLVTKGTISAAEREQIVKDAMGATSGELGETVKGAFQTVFPGLQL